MGTGIVFVVLVAIWVAYFVQYWSRRREHLATARSVEDFAEAMRVLERRPALRTASPDRISSAYAMSPARVVASRSAPRPQVVAKPHPTTPSHPRAGASRMSDATSPRRSPRPTRSPAGTPSRMSPSRKVRGLTLLTALVLTLVSAVLAPLTTLLWWVPLLGVLAVGASFLWLRAGVQAEITARRAARGRRPRRRPRPIADAARRSAGSPEGPGDETVTSPAAAPHADPELLETTEVSAEGHDGPDRWHPVPVPPPTYTLKARAERPDLAERSTTAPPESTTPEARPAETSSSESSETSVSADAPVQPSERHGEPESEQRAAYGT